MNAESGGLGALLGPGPKVEPALLEATFSIQSADVVAAAMAPSLLRFANEEAPGVTFRFRPEEGEASPGLRDGRIDLEVGSIDHVDPETRVDELVRLRMVAAVRSGHHLTRGVVTPERLAAARHVVVSRRGRFSGPLDAALAGLQLERRVGIVVPSHVSAMSLAARTDFVCLVPAGPADEAPSLLTGVAVSMGLQLIDIPVELPSLMIGMAWHPRFDADGAHRWLRSAVRRTFRQRIGPGAAGLRDGEEQW
ncbi:hypothetical protein GCM10028815_24410 [Mariniluteicoccus flavus]